MKTTFLLRSYLKHISNFCQRLLFSFPCLVLCLIIWEIGNAIHFHILYRLEIPSDRFVKLSNKMFGPGLGVVGTFMFYCPKSKLNWVVSTSFLLLCRRHNSLTRQFVKKHLLLLSTVEPFQEAQDLVFVCVYTQRTM